LLYNENIDKKIMKQPNSISNTIFDELLTTVESIGIEKTIKTLKDAKLNALTLEDSGVDYVITLVSQITNISKDKILHGNERNDEKKIAIALSVYFVKQETHYSFSQLKKIFNKDEASLYRYNQMIENLKISKKKTDFEKKIDSYFVNIKLLLTEKKIKNAK
jgi:hypothetical protein